MATVNIELKNDQEWGDLLSIILGAALGSEKRYREIKDEIAVLKNASASSLRAERTLSTPSLSLDEAKKLLENSGYVIYKKPTNFGKKKPAGFGKKRKRIRRTKAQIEMDRQKEKVSE